jgi:hypothetical protein
MKEVSMKPCGNINKRENYYALGKKQQISITINGHSCHTGKKGVLTAIPAFGSLTDDSLVEIRVDGKKMQKRIGVFKERREVLEAINKIDR